eukprot:m.174591 g.174591  ORF g.174591 m.174591 type:complete len:503 (-) comp15409_c0_seq11:588-2096(-)
MHYLFLENHCMCQVIPYTVFMKTTRNDHFFICNDRIYDMLGIIIPSSEPIGISGDGELQPLLACGDRSLKLLEGTTVSYTISLASVPTTLHEYDKGTFLYGTDSGTVGLIEITKQSHDEKWVIPNDSNLGGVRSLFAANVVNSGKKEVLVGRDDGHLQVFSISQDNIAEEIYKLKLQSTISSVLVGCVRIHQQPEIIVVLYSGDIIGLAIGTPQNNTRLLSSVADLKKEINDLEAARLNRQTKQSFKQLTPVDINDTFRLNSADACYNLVVELTVSVSFLVLQSNVPVDILDTEKIQRTSSFSPCEAAESNYLLATFSFPKGASRIEMKVRAIEGQYGWLQAYIVTETQPKAALIRRYKICALSLHQRMNENFNHEEAYNRLELSGPFGFGDIHGWISNCFSDLPHRTSTEEATAAYMSTFLGTKVFCTYREGEAVFYSDNISTISILRDVIVKEGTAKNIPIKIKSGILCKICAVSSSIHTTYNIACVDIVLLHALIRSKF